MPSDLDLCRLCADSYSPNPSFDYIEDGAQTGVWVGIKKLPTTDVIVFRGSFSAEDWFRDFDAKMINEFGLGDVHAGFAENLDKVFNNIDLNLRPHPIVTGHSLGAARAAIFSGMLCNHSDDPSSVALFGCPKPGTAALASVLKNIPLSSYRNGNDPVPDVPVFLPDFPYVPVKELIQVHSKLDDDMFPLEAPDHHIQHYVNALGG